MLIGHVVADHVAPSALHLIAHSHTPLHRLLADVKRRAFVRPTAIDDARRSASGGRHDFAGVRAMGTKPGSASMRVSHCRIAGYASKDTSPSGACAVYV